MGAYVDDWLARFLLRHAARYRPFDWPDLSSDEGLLFLEVWEHAFRKARMTEGEADVASIGLASDPPRYRGEHLPAILKAVANARREQATRLTLPYGAGYAEPVAGPIDWDAYEAEGVPRGDVQALWRHLVTKGGGNPDAPGAWRGLRRTSSDGP